MLTNILPLHSHALARYIYVYTRISLSQYTHTYYYRIITQWPGLLIYRGFCFVRLQKKTVARSNLEKNPIICILRSLVEKCPNFCIEASDL